jgi:magnesium-transporting ATPase (P-type)
MFGMSNPLNAMQILFINILMDGECIANLGLLYIHRRMAGPPSQSLGVDPVDPAIMRKPPRKKDEPIINQRLLYRVLFSASMIVTGVMLVYVLALSDDHMSRREQTMVCIISTCEATARCPVCRQANGYLAALLRMLSQMLTMHTTRPSHVLFFWI